MKHSLAIIRHLAHQGYEVHSLIAENRPYALARLSRYTTRTYEVDEQIEEEFIRQLLALLKSLSFDVLIPVGYPVTEFVARHASEIGQFVHLMCPPRIVCEMAGDKLQMSQVAESLHIPTPRTYQIKSHDDLKSLGQDLRFPLVIKGRHESGKGIVAYATDSSKLMRNYEALCQRFNLNSPEEYPILQEYIPGWGCGFFALYQHGVLKRSFMHRRIREYPVSGGASCCAESFFDEDLMALGRQLLDQLRWHGVAMVEFRFDTRTNRFTLIEVNAKFWGSLELSLKAGADFVGDYVRGALGEQLEFSQSFKKIRFQWPFDGDLLHAVENPRARGSVMRDFFNPLVSKGFHWTDPLPTLFKAYGVIRAVFGLGTHSLRKWILNHLC
jgi:predicted ATP-grasp superfamily ATP-dependent carboligase